MVVVMVVVNIVLFLVVFILLPIIVLKVQQFGNMKLSPPFIVYRNPY